MPPEKPGRNVMELPPLPVAVARANGEIATVCTHPHRSRRGSDRQRPRRPEPKKNPPPRPQREEWTALKKALLWGGLGLVLGALARVLRLPQLTKPKPPAAAAAAASAVGGRARELDEVRHAGLLDAQRYAEYFDRVSDAVRGYLGARFGFDGLESTSDETDRRAPAVGPQRRGARGRRRLPRRVRSREVREPRRRPTSARTATACHRPIDERIVPRHDAAAAPAPTPRRRRDDAGAA